MCYSDRMARLVLVLIALKLAAGHALEPKGLMVGMKFTAEPTMRIRAQKRQIKVRVRKPRLKVQLRRTENIVPIVTVNNSLLTARYVMLKGGRAYISVDGNYLKAFGLKIVRDRRDGVQSIYLVRENVILKMSLGKPHYFVNGVKVKARKAKPFLNRGKMMIPFRWIAENLNYRVVWNNAAKEVSAFA